MLDISHRFHPVQEEQTDCRRNCCTPTITNYYANEREKASFWKILCYMTLLEISSLVFIRGRTWSKEIFHKFKNNTFPIFLFQCLLPRPFYIFAMHQGNQQGRVGMRILLETPPVEPSPSGCPTYYYRRETK